MSRLMELSRKAATITSSLLKPTQNPNIGQIRHYYMSRLFPKSNSSFKLSNGNALTADVVRLSDEMYLVDSGIGSPRTCLENELVVGAKNKNKVRFENRVGFLDLVAEESLIRLFLLERFFIDIVAGDSSAKKQALARFNDMVGSSADVEAVAAGEPLLVLPRRYRQKRVAMELQKVWRTSSQVKGFCVGRNRSGYAVAIAGYVAFLPNRSSKGGQKMLTDRFTIETLNFKTGNIVLL